MNHHQPNIDRVIDDAIALADLTGPQTGTASPRRGSNPERPTDKPPVEFAGDEDDRVLAALPFIASTPAGRDFWAVEPTGDWITDVEVGRRHATTLIAEMREGGCTYLIGRCLLGWTLSAIAAKGHAGLAHMVGFASGLSETITRH